MTYNGALKAGDCEYILEHRTLSSDLELHKLIVNLKCYKLSQKYKEVLAAGEDSAMQLGFERNA